MGTKCLCKAFLGASALFVFWGGWNVSTDCQAILWAARESSWPSFASWLSPFCCAEGIFLHLIWETGYDNKYHHCGTVPLRCLWVCVVEASAWIENTIIFLGAQQASALHSFLLLHQQKLNLFTKSQNKLSWLLKKKFLSVFVLFSGKKINNQGSLE